MTVQLYCGDCLEILPTLAEKCADAILTDLPYGTTACSWDEIIPFEPMWAQVKRLCKGVFVTTASQPFTSKLVMSNPDWFRYEWVWEKSNGGGFLNANRQPLKRHENVCVFSKNGHTYNPQMGKGKPYRCRRAAAGETTRDQTVAGWVTTNGGERYPVSYLNIPSETGEHPTQKPVALYEYLIRTYTNEGDTVLDFCMGSGTTGVACINTRRNFIGVEKREDYFAIAERRIEEAQRQMVMSL